MAEIVATQNDVIVGESFTNEQCTDKDWLQSKTGLDVASATIAPLSDTGGLNAALLKISIVLTSGEEKTLVLKRNPGSQRSILIGMPREAFFYQYFANRISDIVPKVLYAYGNMETGDKAILMESLSDCIQSGYFFGKHSPHNWYKDLPAIVGYENESPVRVQAMEVVAESAFLAAAKLHRVYWNDRSLLEFGWLRGREWMRGSGEESWLAAQRQATEPWVITKAKIAEGKSGVNWDPYLLEIVDASLAKISWESYQSSLAAADFVFTLAHSDFHPANMMWRRSSNPAANEPETGATVLLDWEVVGFGSGPQECAQYFISHMRPSERQACEQRLIRAYYGALTAPYEGGSRVDSSTYTFERCWADYVAGGVGRFVWMLCLLSTLCPDNWVQYFHDQLLTFSRDHGITVENVPMPRV